MRARLPSYQGPERRQRASLGEALLFDLRTPPSHEEYQIAEQRAAQLTNIPLLLAFTHLISAGALWFRTPAGGAGTSDFLFATLGLALVLDAIVYAALRLRMRFRLPPHAATRFALVYVAAATAFWALFGHICYFSDALDGATLTAVVIAAGATTMAIVAIASPPMALAISITGLVGGYFFTTDNTVISGIAAIGLALCAYSLSIAATAISLARRRLVLDAKAHQALRFVTEFETSGRGWFWETDAHGVLTYVSPQLSEDFDCLPDEMLGKRFTDLLSIDSRSSADIREERTLGFHLSARFPFADVVVRAALEDDIQWSLSGNPVFAENGRFLGFRGMGADLTEQRRSEQEISRLARFDSLTGLPNRAMMRQTLDEALRNAARRKKGCSLFLIDLDRFKNVNDTLGHPTGDVLLRQVAERLTSVMGNHGQVGRLGGDEFKAVLPGTVETGLLESLARTMIEQVSRPYQIDGHRVSIGASIGIAIGDPGRSCADSMTRNADLALYAAKAAGRGVHRFFAPSMHSEASDRQMLENDLRGAIDRGELRVVYQPIVRAAGEDVCGFEALARWDHPSRGPVSPEKFIGIAEECGLIGKIGAWVLDTAIAEAANWPDEVRLAINLSPIQFNDPSIVETIATILQKHSFRAERLELEITEGVFLADSEATDETFSRLKAIGVRLALDDFGTGYSSLGYLRKAPFDKIKIDQGFVRGASVPSSRNAAIIRAIVTLAESLGMDTTAEGVETHDDLNLIRELGCSQIQGYIFGKPADAEVARKLAAQAALEPDGFKSVREPRQRLMRRGIIMLGGKNTEIRLRNISVAGALVECPESIAPGAKLTVDIVGVGPVVGSVRWSQAGRFGLQFDEPFDMSRLVPIKKPPQSPEMMQPWHIAADRWKPAEMK